MSDKTCSVEDCTRPVKAKGLCGGHWSQQYRGLPLGPIKEYRKLHRDEKGRVCTACGTYKKWSEFYVRPNGLPQSQCKPCCSRKSRSDYLARHSV